MTAFDFDAPIDRRTTASEKWDRYKGRDIIPLWVADMDFQSPPAVIDALQERVHHGVFGYTAPSETLVAAVCDMFDSASGWKIDPDWLVWLPGLVCGLNVACRTAGAAGDAIATFVPIYPPFLTAPALAGRSVVTAPLQRVGDRWDMDLEGLIRALTPRTRMLLLCNPHNPVGRVWSGPELEAVAEIALRHDLIICADEIHAGLVLDPEKSHIPIATLGPDIARRTITLNAPSKTYNLPGLGCSFAVIPDPGLRRDFKVVMAGIVPRVNQLGLAAAEAAYRQGEPWRQALLSYLRGNRDHVLQAIAAMPGLQTTPIEATYLAWIDTRSAGIGPPGQFFEQAGVGLFDGVPFGAPGFVRLNFGCRRSLLAVALQRMRTAISCR